MLKWIKMNLQNCHRTGIWMPSWKSWQYLKMSRSPKSNINEHFVPFSTPMIYATDLKSCANLPHFDAVFSVDIFWPFGPILSYGPVWCFLTRLSGEIGPVLMARKTIFSFTKFFVTKMSILDHNFDFWGNFPRAPQNGDFEKF